MLRRTGYWMVVRTLEPEGRVIPYTHSLSDEAKIAARHLHENVVRREPRIVKLASLVQQEKVVPVELVFPDEPDDGHPESINGKS